VIPPRAPSATEKIKPVAKAFLPTLNRNAISLKEAALPNNQALTLAKLIVENERLASTIYTTILTPEQRAKADRWRQQLPSRLDGIADRMLPQQLSHALLRNQLADEFEISPHVLLQGLR